MVRLFSNCTYIIKHSIIHPAYNTGHISSINTNYPVPFKYQQLLSYNNELKPQENRKVGYYSLYNKDARAYQQFIKQFTWNNFG